MDERRVQGDGGRREHTQVKALGLGLECAINMLTLAKLNDKMSCSNHPNVTKKKFWGLFTLKGMPHLLGYDITLFLQYYRKDFDKAERQKNCPSRP